MSDISARLVGVELYFEDLQGARKFYLDTLGLHISDGQPGHHAKFATDAAFVCLETLFFEVHDLRAAVTAIGAHRFLRSEPHWAVLHDPEGHNVLLLEAGPG